LAVALTLAMLGDAGYRRRLRRPFVFLTRGLAPLLIRPSLAWFWRHGGDLTEQYAPPRRLNAPLVSRRI
jgi:hypothetical protein